MKPERWRLLVNLYQQASECEESQRADFLKKACAGDDELRQEVESWLAQEERAQNFIEQPAVHQVARELQNAHSSWFMRPVGPYQVLSLLGAGGMGEVYLARDAKLDRRVALKFLPPENEHDPAYRRRLLLEAKAAAAVDHPYVCKIYAIEEVEGKTFLVLEYVEGRTLKERICEGQVESEEVLRIASEIAEALAEAHFRHVIHRDIKPANIMLTPGGHVKVMDFGVAKYVPGTDRSTPDQRTTGVLIGTPQYMAPEQFLGEPADARSDIFSFGIVLYELASGVHPFGRATPQEIARALINENHRPLALAATGIPEGLNSVVDRMLAKDSRLRYESMQQVWADLRQQQNRIGKSAVRERAIEEEFPVAVLPFMDLSPTGNQEYFCDGIVEELKD
jgi:serine/threonine protein kinase